MRSCQGELERVEGQLEKRSQDIGELQARLQDAEKILVSVANTGCCIHVYDIQEVNVFYLCCQYHSWELKY